MQSLKPNYAEAKAPAQPENFVGEVAMQTLVTGAAEDVEILAVWFKNGARNIPHAHSVDQLLVVVEGKCVVATQSEKAIVEAGQSAFIPKGEWHWHGASTTQTAMHLSIKKAGPTDWNQPRHDFDEWKPQNLA